jgi:predicted XRE-type DNA-binding protein
LKSQVAAYIKDLINHKGWTQAQAAVILGISEAVMSNIMRSILSGFSLDRLLNILSRLDQHVDIVVRPKAAGEETRIKLVAV